MHIGRSKLLLLSTLSFAWLACSAGAGESASEGTAALATSDGGGVIQDPAMPGPAMPGPGPAPAPGGAGAGAPGICWNLAFTLNVNMMIDMPLDPALMEAQRINDVWGAAGDWNAELAAIGSPVRIQINIVHQPNAAMPAGNGDWAADWNNNICVDNVRGGTPVFTPDFGAGHGHQFNGANTTSFGHDPAAMPNSAGWTALADTEVRPTPEAGGDVLGLASFRRDPAIAANPANNAGLEADIVFNTHKPDCGLIPWSYIPQPPGALGTFSFRSVALHEIGHALGVGHLGPDNVNPANANNVMQPIVRMNTPRVITQLERDALVFLYGARGTCPPVGGAVAPGGANVPMPGNNPPGMMPAPAPMPAPAGDAKDGG